MAQLVLIVRGVEILLKNKKWEIIKSGGKYAYAVHAEILIYLPTQKGRKKDLNFQTCIFATDTTLFFHFESKQNHTANA